MERNRDFRTATISAGNGLTRRRQRITTLKDSTEEDRDMELQETVRLRDRDRLQKKDRDREFSKRRKVESHAAQQRSGGGGESYRENDSTDASDEEYREEEDDARIHYLNRMNQPSLPSSSFPNNRRSLRSLRSSPMLRNAVDEMIGVPIPRRARSTSTKRLHEYSNSGSGRLGEDLSRRVFSPSPATASLVSAGGASSSSSGAFLKKKMKSVEPRTSALNSSSNSRPPSVIQDDIEIEVVEALFDLMKQSQSLSLSKSSKRQERLDKNDKNTADEGLTKSGKDDIHTNSVRNKHSIKVDAETIMVDSMEEIENEERIEIEKFPDDSVLESADGFLDEGKVVTPKESVSPSNFEVNAGEIQDPTVTKANIAAIVVETKKETKLEIDLMAPPPLPSSPEKDVSVDLSSLPKFMVQDVQKKSETFSKDGPLAVTIRPKEEERGAISSNQSPNFNLEKHHHDTSSVRDGSKQLQWGPKEQKNQMQTSLLPFPISMSGWPGALPHPGYMPHLQAVLPMDGARFPTAVQPPKFKLSQPRPKRSATHQYIACNIHYHQQLITKSLWSGPTGAATFYGTKPLNPNSIPPTQRLIPGNPLLGDYQGRQSCATISGARGKGKGSEVPAALNATKSKDLAVQQGPLQSSANNFLHGPAFVFPLGHHQTNLMSPAKPTGQPQSASAVGSLSLPSNSAGGPSVHLSMPGEAAAMNFNNPKLPSNEVTPYMLQNKNSQFPPSMNIAMPQLKGGTQGPTMPLFNSSFYSSPMFSVSQSQQLLSLPYTPALSGTKIGDNNFPTLATVNSQQAEKQQIPPSLLSSKFDREIVRKGSAPLADGLAPHPVKPNNGQTCSFPVQPMNFAIIPPGPIGAAAAVVGNKHGDIQQLGSKGRAELVPQAFALSFGSNASTGPPLNFSSMAQNSAIFQMLPDIAWNGYQMAQQQSFQTSEGKSAVGSTKMDDGLKGILGKSQTGGGQSSKSGSTDISALSMMGTSMVDGLARAVNVIPSSSSANQQPFPSSSVAQTSGVSVMLPNLHHHHQQQAIQLQKHHMQQMQLTGTAQLKASTANGMSGSFLPSSFPSNHPIFSQVSVQTDNSSYSSHCQNLPRTTAPEGSPQSANSNVVNIPQGRSSQGHTHISFGSSLVSAASFQGQQVVTNNQPALAVGLPSNSSIPKNTGSSQRTASHISNAGSTISALPSQQTDASQNGPSQKSSPACGRNVPSILSTCPSHLSELKY